MVLFNRYAHYYDLLYHDKNYADEAKFIQGLLSSYSPNAKTILELGCGTGEHSILLIKEGYEVHGVDLSAEMLERAKQKQIQLPEELSHNLSFSQANIRSFRSNKRFDVVLSLFHVVSYQTTNRELEETFETVSAHLKPGGIFVFDCWYGPAVLTERPSVRVKRIEDENIIVTRIAEPQMDSNQNCVTVNYQVFIKDRTSHSVEELQESHCMRYLFSPEIHALLNRFQLEPIQSAEWLSQKDPGFDTWGVYFVARKRESSTS